MGLRGILRIWALGLFLHLPDLRFGIFTRGFGHLWQEGRIVEAIQCSSRAWHLPAWGFGTSYGSDLFLHWSSLSIQPLEACRSSIGTFCSSFYYVYWSHLLSIPDRPPPCSGFFYLWIKSDLQCFGLSIILLILHMVEVCSITVYSCLLFQYTYKSST